MVEYSFFLWNSWSDKSFDVSGKKEKKNANSMLGLKIIRKAIKDCMDPRYVPSVGPK